ncbi:protein of unknown function [Paraburkholderia dioscoreae]|uniref:Uncharacterized protein n=1 Tax=Paraburkholderia dioscoreae TaxID=2604047 RepID=A0A5Q4Z9L5_9BURK|nr:protein of unknown function [Paraburkholderia dioscoreae]
MVGPDSARPCREVVREITSFLARHTQFDLLHRIYSQKNWEVHLLKYHMKKGRARVSGNGERHRGWQCLFILLGT